MKLDVSFAEEDDDAGATDKRDTLARRGFVLAGGLGAPRYRDPSLPWPSSDAPRTDSRDATS